MKKNRCAISYPFALLSCLLCLAVQGHAQTTALSFSGHGSEVDQFDFTWGWSFSLANPVTVTDLGVWDGNNTTRLGPGGDGLLEAHSITIWTTAGVQVAQATVPIGTAGVLLNDFRYISLLSPTSLPAGNYVIGAYSQNSADSFALLTSGMTTAPGVTYIADRQQSGIGMPITSSGVNGFFGPNFRFTSAVPDEAPTWMLLLAAMSGLFALRLYYQGMPRKLGC